MKALFFLFLAVGMLFIAFVAQAGECYDARWPNAEVFVTAVVDGEDFFATYEDRCAARQHAQNLGLCVKDYGVLIENTNPITKVAVKWQKKDGFSVWR